MKRVAASEFDLLTVARALVRDLEAAAVEPLLRQPRRVPGKLGSTAIGLLKQILARGVVLELCRRGGWREADHLRGDEVVQGRLWERWARGGGAPPALHFSGLGLRACRWLTVAPLAVPRECEPLGASRTPGLGDQLVLYLACDLSLRCGCSGALATSPAFRRAPLCWLGFPEVLAAGGAPEEEGDLEGEGLEVLLRGDGALVLEALQLDLARRWVAAERSKGAVADPGRMTALGLAQERVLGALMEGARRAGRRDLLGFVPEAAARLLRHRPAARRWVASLSRQSSLQQREAACRGAGAFLRALERHHRWAERARTTRFFDDDYEAGQLLLRQWEPLGAGGLDHARLVTGQLTSLDASLLAGTTEEEAR
jgi:hypothetical protein